MIGINRYRIDKIRAKDLSKRLRQMSYHSVPPQWDETLKEWRISNTLDGIKIKTTPTIDNASMVWEGLFQKPYYVSKP